MSVNPETMEGEPANNPRKLYANATWWLVLATLAAFLGQAVGNSDWMEFPVSSLVANGGNLPVLTMTNQPWRPRS